MRSDTSQWLGTPLNPSCERAHVLITRHIAGELAKSDANDLRMHLTTCAASMRTQWLLKSIARQRPTRHQSTGPGFQPHDRPNDTILGSGLPPKADIRSGDQPVKFHRPVGTARCFSVPPSVGDSIVYWIRARSLILFQCVDCCRCGKQSHGLAFPCEGCPKPPGTNKRTGFHF